VEPEPQCDAALATTEIITLKTNTFYLLKKHLENILNTLQNLQPFKGQFKKKIWLRTLVASYDLNYRYRLK
jgi:hypothetical protein